MSIHIGSSDILRMQASGYDIIACFNKSEKNSGRQIWMDLFAAKHFIFHCAWHSNEIHSFSPNMHFNRIERSKGLLRFSSILHNNRKKDKSGGDDHNLDNVQIGQLSRYTTKFWNSS